MRDFADRTAVVTGAASGIGRAVALALADAGATVLGADRDADGLGRLVAARPGIVGRIVDVASTASVQDLGAYVVEQFGHADIVVNAAGWDRAEPFLDSDETLWRQLVDINYLGPVRICHTLVAPMLRAGAHGRIVNLASDAARVGSGGESVYAGAKGGVVAFTKSLARETARHRITVNCVCPGPTDTPLFAAQPEHLQAALIRATPFRRTAAPTEVADAVVFLASNEAEFITGQVLSVSGGLTMAG